MRSSASKGDSAISKESWVGAAPLWTELRWLLGQLHLVKSTGNFLQVVPSLVFRKGKLSAEKGEFRHTEESGGVAMVTKRFQMQRPLFIIIHPIKLMKYFLSWSLINLISETMCFSCKFYQWKSVGCFLILSQTMDFNQPNKDCV